MVKIGPAFFDYISSGSEKIRPRGKNINIYEFTSVVPLLLLFLGMGLILVRLFYLQIVRGDYYRDLSENNRTRTKIIPAPRGIIYDRNGKALVLNSEIFKIEKDGKERVISRELALKLISEDKKVQRKIRREYPYKDAFAHVLGYLGPISEEQIILPSFSEYSLTESIGMTGLERAYEESLHGQNGRELWEVDAGGREIRSLGERQPVQGKNLETTLDLNLQLAVKDAMDGVERGAVVASDPKTGGILSLYSKPSFDPNVFISKDYKPENGDQSRESLLADSLNQPLLNRAISGAYPPGSTFKLITAVAALADGAIKKDTIIEDTGILRIGDFSFGNWYFLQYGKTEGPLDVVGAIKRSNDIFFYKAAEKAGVENISSFAREFGLGKKLNIDIQEEEEGLVPSPSWKEEQIGEPWYLGDTYNYGIGQGYLLTTPLQINVMTGVFANGGTLYRPHLVSSQKKIIRKHFLKSEHLELIREGMRQSCETGGVAWPFFDFRVKNERLPVDNEDYVEEASGSPSATLGTSARSVRIKVACKTGTAEVTHDDAKPHAWITVFAPFYDPEIVLTVLIENGGEGSSVAGQIAKKILTDYFEQK